MKTIAFFFLGYNTCTVSARPIKSCLQADIILRPIPIPIPIPIGCISMQIWQKNPRIHIHSNGNMLEGGGRNKLGCVWGPIISAGEKEGEKEPLPPSECRSPVILRRRLRRRRGDRKRFFFFLSLQFFRRIYGVVCWGSREEGKRTAARY